MGRPGPVLVLAVVGLVTFVVTMVSTLGAARPTALVTAVAPTTGTGSDTVARPSGPRYSPLPLDGTIEVTGIGGWWSWALVDLRTGEVWSSANADEVTRSASMSKAWLAALYLREHPDPPREWLNTLSRMIRDSDNAAADRVYYALGARVPVVEAMTEVCGVEGPYIGPGWTWPSTMISARDAALLAACIGTAKVADARWTAWLLDEMRQVRGDGDFGIREAFPPHQRQAIAIKNGWANGWDDGLWYINCMAIGPSWALVVEARSPSARVAMDACVSVPRQLLGPPPTPSDRLPI